MSAAAKAAGESLPDIDDLLEFLPNGAGREVAFRVEVWLAANPEAVPANEGVRCLS
ncbi:MAG: hypothetical protein OSB29_00625 [Verrucomicrobiota bacterium]|nr:hypothetical protein [Verrucomicrobiota bacterium]